MPSVARQQKNEKMISAARELENTPWCDDYEKMISGMLYNCMAPDLERGRFRARRLAAKFNTYVPPEDGTLAGANDERIAILKQLFGRIGRDCCVEPNIQVDYGCNIILGDNFYANFNTVILDCALVTIGDRVLFGTGVSLITATHETSLKSRMDFIEYAEPITIGDDCWLGSNVTVLPGVTIGKGCTIAAGAVVSKDVPEYSVAMGVPARVVKKVEPVDFEQHKAEKKRQAAAAMEQ